MAHQKIIDSVKKQGQVTIKDLDEFLRFVINEYDMRTLNNNYMFRSTRKATARNSLSSSTSTAAISLQDAVP